MPAKVRDWMSKPVVVIDPDSSVSFALTLMRRRNIHSVIVNVDPANHIYGIITSTDIRDKIIAQDRNPVDTHASEIMSAPLISANPDWTLKECSIEMQKHKIHHMPVGDENGNLIGLISATDIFRAAEEIGWHSS
ncbi:MAG: CBS domain-containing protein [Anaerolineales bacterium]|jgi:CBS domain-containing protein